MLASLLLACRILAQTQSTERANDVTVPPPAITFDAMTEIQNDEFSRIFETSFPSAFVSTYVQNNTVPLRIFLPTDTSRPVPVVLILHYWGATDLRLESQMARELNTLGSAAVIMTLPYHLSRTPKGTKSGELALQPDTHRLIDSMTQSVWDIRRTLDWIETRPELDKSKIGLAGTSLGGIVSALAFGIDHRIRLGSFVLAGADLAGILWNSSRVVSQREEMRRNGYTEEKLRAALTTIEPLTYLKPEVDRPSLVIAASLDTIVPPENAKKLIGGLYEPNVVWMETGHFGGALVRSRIVRTVARFFETGFRGQRFANPPAIHAPTLRFGLAYTDVRGLQVALSTDIWQADPRNKTFAAAVLTPNGLQGFVGHRLTKELALGLMVFPTKTTLGATWNIAF